MKTTEKIDDYFGLLKSTLDRIDRYSVQTFIQLLIEGYRGGKHIFIFGNGGSAATASHFVNDFNKGVSEGLNAGFRLICLNDNIPTLTAIANDIGYEEVFRLQLRNLLNPGDLVIGLSGSGNSANVINAMEYAKSHGATTFAFLGFDGGKLRSIADHIVLIPVNNMQIVEDIHMIMDHLVMTIVREHLNDADQ